MLEKLVYFMFVRTMRNFYLMEQNLHADYFFLVYFDLNLFNYKLIYADFSSFKCGLTYFGILRFFYEFARKKFHFVCKKFGFYCLNNSKNIKIIIFHLFLFFAQTAIPHMNLHAAMVRAYQCKTNVIN